MKKEINLFINKIEHTVKREDAKTLVKILTDESGYEAKLNENIIGFGNYRYSYANGREGISMVTAFAPRKQNIAIYIMPGFSSFSKELENIGKHKSSKCCLYINKLADVNEIELRKIVKQAVIIMQKKYECFA